jgi:hypothetical protein
LDDNHSLFALPLEPADPVYIRIDRPDNNSNSNSNSNSHDIAMVSVVPHRSAPGNSHCRTMHPDLRVEPAPSSVQSPAAIARQMSHLASTLHINPGGVLAERNVGNHAAAAGWGLDLGAVRLFFDLLCNSNFGGNLCSETVSCVVFGRRQCRHAARCVLSH